VDQDGQRFKRARQFKVYLTNPSIRSALFAPIDADAKPIGGLAETAVFSQWFHTDHPLYYGRWKSGEVDIISLGPTQPEWAVEVKWSDRYVDKPGELRSLVDFCTQHGIDDIVATSRSVTRDVTVDNQIIRFIPTALYCLTVGFNLTSQPPKGTNKPAGTDQTLFDKSTDEE